MPHLIGCAGNVSLIFDASRSIIMTNLGPYTSPAGIVIGGYEQLQETQSSYELTANNHFYAWLCHASLIFFV